jgi:WD40 repeat protein
VVTYTEGGKLVVVAGEGFTAYNGTAADSYNTETGKNHYGHGLNPEVLHIGVVSYSEVDKSLIYVTEKDPKLWGYAGGLLDKKRFRKLPYTRVAAGAVTPDGVKLAIAGVPWNGDTLRIDVRDMKTTEVTTLATTPSCTALAFSPDGHFLAAFGTGPGMSGSVIVVYDLTSHEAIASYPCARCFSLAFAPNNKTLAAARGTDLALWDISAPDQPARILPGSATAVAFSPDGTTIATASGSTVLLRPVP